MNKKGKKDEPAASTKSLHTFFQPASEEQRWQRRNVGASKSSKAVVDDIIEDGEEDDLIEDDFSDDGLLVMSQLAANANGGGSFGTRSTSSTQDTARKEKSKLGPKASGVRKPVNNSNTKKRFILPTSPVPEKRSPKLPDSEPEVLQPWAERFAPSGLDELAVHKRKVTDVQRWLEDVFLGRNRRVCILRRFSTPRPLPSVWFRYRELVLTAVETSRSQGPCWQWKDNHRFVTVESSWLRCY